MKAWYFAPKGNRLRYGDGRLIRAGITHTIEGSPKTCALGLHGSERVIDALSYAETPILYRVELSGEMDIGSNKVAAQSRKYIKRYNVEKVLREFARKQALINIEKIKTYCSEEDYKLIMDWLLTGNEKYQSVARLAASAARSAWAARSAARAAESAAWAARAAESAESALSAARSAANTMLEQMIGEMK